METQYNVLSYRVDLYINDYKLSIEIDWNVNNDKNIGYKRKRQKAIKQDLGCKFILALILRKKILIFLFLFLFWYFIFGTINEIFRHIMQSTKTALINKFSTRLLGLEFKSSNIMKSKAVKFVIKKFLPHYNYQWKQIASVVKKLLRTKM